MVTAWRIVKSKYALTALDGEGARRAGGRWTSIGRKVVYASSTRALAALEMLAHLESATSLPGYSLIELGIPEPLISSIAKGKLPPDWKAYPAPSSLLAIGDAWLDAASTAVLKVPSALTEEDNYLLNPLHPDFPLITKGRPVPFPIDPRLVID